MYYHNNQKRILEFSMLKTNLIVSTLSFLIIACGSNMPKIPDWYLNAPDKEGFKYAAGTEVGDEIQNAVDEARLIAVGVLGQQLDTELNGVVARAQEEIRDKAAVDNFKNTQESIFSVKVTDYKVVKQEIVEDNGKYRAYVLIEYDMNAAQQRLIDKLKADKALFEAIRATELYEEMEQKVEAYRKRNKS